MKIIKQVEFRCDHPNCDCSIIVNGNGAIEPDGWEPRCHGYHICPKHSYIGWEELMRLIDEQIKLEQD